MALTIAIGQYLHQLLTLSFADLEDAAVELTQLMKTRGISCINICAGG